MHADNTIPSFNNTEIAFQYRSNKALKMARLLFASMSSPLLTQIGIQVTTAAFRIGLPIQGIIRNTIFKQFCGGETINDAAATAALIAPYGVNVILDYGVEGKDNEQAYDLALSEFVKAIDYAATQEDIPFISLKVTGFARFGLLEKMHQQHPLNEDEQQEWQRIHQRVEAICKRGAEKRVMVLIDAEESWIQEPVDELANAMMAQFNRNQTIVFNTFQLYRHDRLAFLKLSCQQAKEQGYTLGAKLVRGAYMEKERKRAEEMGYPSPIQPNKESTDHDFDEGVAFCLERLDSVNLFIGTHNEASCMKAVHRMNELNIPFHHPHVYFSQLYGMSDNISFNLAASGFRVSKYLPYGPVKDVMPYLMRRAQENTSVAGQTGRELALIDKEIARRKNRH